MKYCKLPIFLVVVLMAVGLVSAQDAESTPETAPNDDDLTSDSIVYICMVEGDSLDIIEYTVTETFGVVFERDMIVTVFSSFEERLAVDLIKIEPDTTSGTYRWVDTFVNGANLTRDVPGRNLCRETFPEQLSELVSSISLPVSSQESLVIRKQSNPVDYMMVTQNATLITGAIGVILRGLGESNLPNFQILKFTGGIDDTVAVAFPTIGEEIDLYIVSRQRITYFNRDALGLDSPPSPLDSRDRFLSRLNANNGNLIDTVMTEGQFRMVVGFGKEVFYEPNGSLHLERIRAFAPRGLLAGMSIAPITCLIDEDSTVPYFRAEDFAPENYLQSAPANIAGRSNCSNQTIITNILPNGILEVNTSGNSNDPSFQIASWLVEPVQ